MERSIIASGLILIVVLGSGCQNAQPAELSPALKLNVGSPMKQFRFVPVQLQDQRALLAVHSNHINVDPYHRFFSIPTDTMKLTLFSTNGKRLWTRDLGPGVMPGHWFCPVFPFDLDGDGTDEIYLVNNDDPDHALNFSSYVIEKISSETGKTIGSTPWPWKRMAGDMHFQYRYFINAGFSKGQRRLIAAQGTYRQLNLACWDESFNQVWSRVVPEKAGPRGSHMFPILDIDGDGRDELFYGERCIDIDTGKDIWVGDEEKWLAHSDVIQPTLDLATGRWFIHTCREGYQDPDNIGIVMFDDKGKEVWGYRGMTHVDAGWSARLKDNGEHLCFGLDITGKTAKVRSGLTEHLYDMKGNPVELPFSLAETLPVDFNGDGLHELVYTGSEQKGKLIGRKGEQIAQLSGTPAFGGKILDLPGEQVITWDKDGTVRIYACPDAKDTPEAIRRYEHPYYAACLRIWAMGYNRVNLGGL